MNIEHPDQEFINLEPRPPAEKEPLILPDYPEELKFSPLFSNADTLGGQWDIQNDDLLSLTLEPREIKAAAANLQWLAFQENLPLEEIAPVADLYRDTYSKEWFGGTVENELQFYDAIALRLKHQEEEEDRYDKEIIENTWRTEHPKLDFALKILNSTLGTVFNGLGVQTDEEPLTRAEQYQRYRSSVSRLADLNPDSFNPSQAFVHDDGDGNLVLNPEGIGGFFGGFILGGGTNFLARGPRTFSIRKTIGARIAEAKKRLKAIGGVTYDPDTKAFYEGNRRIPDDEISEHIRSKASDFPIILQPEPPLTPSKVTPPDTTPTTRAVPDRNIERYDGATDTFHDRGNVIAGKDIETYLEHRNQVPSTQENLNTVGDHGRSTVSNSNSIPPSAPPIIISDGPGAMARLTYEAAPYHGKKASGRKSAGPTNGQDALDFSIVIKDTSPRRVGIDYSTGEIVIFDRTEHNTYHGHICSWKGLPIKAQNALFKTGMTDRKGNIIK